MYSCKRFATKLKNTNHINRYVELAGRNARFIVGLPLFSRLLLFQRIPRSRSQRMSKKRRGRDKEKGAVEDQNGERQESD